VHYKLQNEEEDLWFLQEEQRRGNYTYRSGIVENNIKQKRIHWSYIRCSFKFPVKVGVEESIVNAPLVSLQIKNTNIAKSEVRADP
jgi:hypothetical protein